MVSSVSDIQTLTLLNEIGTSLSSETNIDRLLETILEKARFLTQADNGALYLLNNNNQLEYSIMQSTTLKIKIGGTTGKRAPFAPVKLYNNDGTPNHNRVASYVALNKESINIKNLYSKEAAERFDFASAHAFDKLKNYHSQSLLAIPLKNPKNEVLGVLHLVNARGKNGIIIPFSNSMQSIIESLASQAAVALENRLLIAEQNALLDGIIQMIALAIDTKSPHTGHHCEAIPIITEMIAEAACKQKKGVFKDFDFTEEEWHELKVASWLHDCGKLTTPLSILEKETKLQTVFDRIALIETRLEVLLRDAEIAVLKGKMQQTEYNTIEQQYRNDLAFLNEINKGAEHVDDNTIARVDEIAKYTWKPRLSDKRKTPFFTKDELENLHIRKGTLTEAERKIMRDHIVVTIDMLESLPFPRNLRRVPEYAGGHHEKMDGTGYPKGLTRDEMSIPARMMAVADIFEALTSSERPYKKPNTLSEALTILANMKRNNHIDPDVFDLFVKEKVYLKYAKKHLLPEQIDTVDETAIMALSGD